MVTRTLVTDGNPDLAYQVPSEELFKDDSGDDLDYLPAADLRRIGEALIDDKTSTLGFFRSFRVKYYWRRTGGKSRGQPVYGRTEKAGPREREEQKVDLIVWLAADHARNEALTGLQLEALVYRQLVQVWMTEDGTPTLRAPDFLAWKEEVVRYGDLLASMTEGAREVQLRLFRPAEAVPA